MYSILPEQSRFPCLSCHDFLSVAFGKPVSCMELVHHSFQEKVVLHWVGGTDFFFFLVIYSHKTIVRETSPSVRELKYTIYMDLVIFTQISS